MKSYSIITKIHNRKFQNKKILLVGAGKMASQYASTLKNMNINDVYVISKNKQKTKKFCEKYNFNLFDGSLNNLKNYKMDLIIVTPSIDVTLKLLDEILKNVQQNVLVEKPVSLYSNKIKSCIKLTGFVNSTDDFTDQPKVINGASDLIASIFGDAGMHARAAVSTNSLPLGVSVEVDAIFELN